MSAPPSPLSSLPSPSSDGKAPPKKLMIRLPTSTSAASASELVPPSTDSSLSQPSTAPKLKLTLGKKGGSSTRSTTPPSTKPIKLMLRVPTNKPTPTPAPKPSSEEDEYMIEEEDDD